VSCAPLTGCNSMTYVDDDSDKESLAQHQLVGGISPNLDSPIRVTHRRFLQLIGMTLAARAEGHNRSRQKISGPRS
jgi:hypothetical protein